MTEQRLHSRIDRIGTKIPDRIKSVGYDRKCAIYNSEEDTEWIKSNAWLDRSECR